MEPAYVVVWEFEARPGCEADFEAHYGPDGNWARLFHESPGYIGTLLLRDNAVQGRYLTVDRWRSKDAFGAFRARHDLAYATLDAACARLTTAERELGAYAEWPATPRSAPTQGTTCAASRATGLAPAPTR